ncbi:MAG: hypothetical protein GX087_00735 [Desulfobulbaceae bacterium]|nr:hypothetical protein [Desulfobulbaceae bacterium]
MDGRQSLGIALAEGELSAVLLQASGRSLSVAATATMPVNAGKPGGLTAALNRLCSDLSWREHISCVLGLPLSELSVRNLHLPFPDVKQQAQAFPYELEECLLTPAEQVESVFAPTRSDASGADLLAFAADKELLLQFLPEEREWRFDPDIICPSMHALAVLAGEAMRGKGSFILTHADLHAAEIALIQDGVLLACRRVPLLTVDGDAAGNSLVSAETESAVSGQTVLALAAAIRQSLILFRQGRAASVSPAAPSRSLLCGPLAASLELQTMLAENLQVRVQGLGQILPRNSTGLRQLAPSFDAALACALHGLQPGKAGVHALNFRQGSFSKSKGGFGALWRRKNLRIAASLILVACAGLLVFLAGERHSLTLRSEKLRQEMTQVFRGAFPDAQVVRDPYMEMQAALKGSAAMDSSLLFAQGRASSLSLLAELSSRVPAEMPLTVNRLTLEQDLALLRGQTASFKDVDQIRNSLAASPLFSEVRILSSTAEKSGAENLIRFELRLLRRAAGGSQ